MNLLRIAIALVILLTLALTVLAYPALPDRIPSHWDVNGEVNGYMAKPWGALIVPLILLPLTALLLLLPRVDPLRRNYAAFQRYYDGFILVFAAFLLVVQLQIVLWGLGYQISPTLLFPLAIGALFIYLGFLLEHARQNWFVGIRTPWTLSSERVWAKTHARGGALFKVAGIVALAGALFGPYALWFVLVPVLAVSAYLVAYSYVEFRREQAAPV